MPTETPQAEVSEPGSSALLTEANGTEAKTDHIGSDTWVGGDCYDSNDEWNIQAVKFFRTVKWDLLAAIASRHHNAAKCVYSGKFSIGQFNMVRRLTFENGVSWVVRVRLPQEASPASLEDYDSEKAFELEIAAMKFFKSLSKIPVPEVFAYDADPLNEIGAAYMMMEYIHGTTASELRQLRECQPSTYGTPEQDRRFRHQLARIQAETLAFRFQKIGSLHGSPESGFFIGPDINTGLGPWNSSTDYYNDLTDFLLKRAASKVPTRALESPSFSLPILLRHMLSIYSEETHGPFRLINRDLGAHNVLVDNDFNIVGVVDFDAVGSAPLEAVAQYPVLTGMSIEPPGIVETNPYALERIQRQKKQKDAYRESLAQWEATLGKGLATISTRLETRAACAHEGLTRYAGNMTDENDLWFRSGLHMLREHVTQSASKS